MCSGNVRANFSNTRNIDEPTHFDRLNDEVFLGTLLGVSSYLGHDLVQDIIASRPDDFNQYGVFTCRFYVEGEWVDVITDTRIPCILDSISSTCSPAYGKSLHKDEMWICLVEKAYAKAVGSYESLQKVRVNEALLHLTGGSVQSFLLQDELKQDQGAYNMWKLFKNSLANDTLILCLPIANESAENASNNNNNSNTNNSTTSASHEEGEKKTDNESISIQDEGIMQCRLYSVLAYKEVGSHNLVMLHNPWGNKNEWLGDWNENSIKWDDFPEVYRAVISDPRIIWRRNNPQGFLWMSFPEFLDTFNHVYLCKIFGNNKFKYYCVKGEWRDKIAGGPMYTVADKEETFAAAAESVKKADAKVTLTDITYCLSLSVN